MNLSGPCDKCEENTSEKKSVIVNIRTDSMDLEYNRSFHLCYTCLLELWKDFEEWNAGSQPAGARV